jgi:hypothetical protein
LAPTPLGYTVSMKRIATATVLAIALLFLVAAGNSVHRSGLRGNVLLAPSSPVCLPGSCTRPAAHVLLTFWSNGRVVAHTSTDRSGSFRITLRPRSYGVTSENAGTLDPSRVVVLAHRYRMVRFRLDRGIR